MLSCYFFKKLGTEKKNMFWNLLEIWNEVVFN